MKTYFVYIVLPLFLCCCKNEQPEETPIDFSFYQSCLEEGGSKLDVLAKAFADQKISIDDDFNWAYDFRKEDHDRHAMYENFQQRLFQLADEDEVFLNKISEYYAQWPKEIVEEFTGRPEFGAQKIGRRVKVLQSEQQESK